MTVDHRRLIEQWLDRVARDYGDAEREELYVEIATEAVEAEDRRARLRSLAETIDADTAQFVAEYFPDASSLRAIDLDKLSVGVAVEGCPLTIPLRYFPEAKRSVLVKRLVKKLKI